MASLLKNLNPKIQIALEKLGITYLTPPQEKALLPILLGKNILLVAPTASGKTEAAMLPVFNQFLESVNNNGISIIYVTPLRALNRDMHRRMLVWSELLGVNIQVRHSDSTQKEKRLQIRKPPHMLITTPETFQAILTTHDMLPNLKSVRWIIIDEIHEIAASRRGAQLMVGLERLEKLTPQPFQRIGLSATIGNPQTIATFLGGSHDVDVIEVTLNKNYFYNVEYPTLEEEDFDLSYDLNTAPRVASRIRRIRDLILAHNSTIVFVQGRGQAENLGHRLSILTPDIEVHHGSLSRETRYMVEDKFKAGELKAIVATSTLQLGIDVGNVDLIIQYNSPRQVATLIQRVGRAGHRIRKESRGVLVSSYGEDALECIAITQKGKHYELEPIETHEKPLDVLAHQITGLTLEYGIVSIKTIFEIIKGAYPFRNLIFDEFLEIVDFLDDLKILDRKDDSLVKTKKGQLYYFENLGMINDERRYPFINVITDRVIGTVGDEFWTLRARVGLNVILRGRIWKILQLDEENGRLFVMPSDDPLGALPGWDGELIGVTRQIAESVSDLRVKINDNFEAKGSKAIEELSSEFSVDKSAIKISEEETVAQIRTGYPLPTKKTILLEAYDRYIVIHCSYGSKVNTTFACVLDVILSEHDLILGWWNDAYRILIEAPQKVNKYDVETIKKIITELSVEETDKRITEFLETRFPYTYNMKFIAERFGAIPRGKTLGTDALNRLYRRWKNSPIYKETLREIYKEKLDTTALKEIIKKINDGSISIQIALSKEPSPLACHILKVYADIEEQMESTIGIDQLEYMRKSVHSREAKLACMNCCAWTQVERIRSFPERPLCPHCGSGLLAVLPQNQNLDQFKIILTRWKEGSQLIGEEQEKLIQARKSADLVLSYGRKAIEALAVHGIGPVTAYQILSRMQKDDKELYADLLKAKIHYMRTRQYWDTRKEGFK